MKLSFGSNVLIFIRCLILSVSLLGIPTLAIFWDKLPESLSNALASSGPERKNHEFKTRLDAGKTDHSTFTVETETVAPGNDWGRPTAFAAVTQSAGYGRPVESHESERLVAESGLLVGNTSEVTSSVSEVSANDHRGVQLQNDPLKDELTRLGVDCLDVQPWGNSGSLWRCTCQARSSSLPGACTVCFEAVDTDSNRAVEMVLTKIRDWRATR